MRTAKEVVRNELLSSKNFMTPDIVAYSWITKGERAAEISKGTGMKEEIIYGLTVVDVEKLEPLKTKRRSDLSHCYFSLNEIHREIKRLKEVE